MEVGRVCRQVGELRATELDRALGVAGGHQRLARLEGQVDRVEVGDDPRVSDQLERGLEVPRRLVGTADGHRLVAGLHAGPHGGDRVVRQPRVPCELGGGAVDTARPDRFGVGGVQPDPLTGEQVVVHRLGEQGVPEGVAVGAEPHQDVLLGGGPQRGLEDVVGQAHHGGEQRVADPPAGAGGGADDGTPVVVQPVEPDQQQVGEVVGQPGAVRALGGADQLLGEERVALGAADDRVQVALGQRAGQQRPHQPAYVGIGQRVQLDAVHPGDPQPLGRRRAQGVSAVEVVGAVGREHDDRPAEGAGEQEGEQVAGGAVGPVHVLDDDEHRALLGEVVEGAVDRVEEVGALEVLGGPPTAVAPEIIRRPGRRWESTGRSAVSSAMASGRAVASRPNSSEKGR